MTIPFVADDAVRDRFAELGEEFNIFRGELQAQVPGVTLEIDSAKLYLAVTSYFIDIARYKWWHFPDPENARLDGTKKAAFMAYWLNKLSPVAVRRMPGLPPLLGEDGLPEDPSVFANHYFTIFIAFNYLDFVLSEKLTAKLLYHMLWREETAKSYMLLFEMLDTMLRGDDVFIKVMP